MNEHPKGHEIIFVSRKWPPAIGGMETYSIRLVEELRQHTTVKTMVLPGRENGAPPKALALVGFGIVTFFRLLFQRNRARVLHLGDMAIWPLAIATILRHGAESIVVSAHGTDVSFPRRRTLLGRLYAFYLKFGGLVLHRAEIIANSNATAEETRLYGFQNVSVVPLATDFKRRDAPLQPTQMLFAGRIIPLKGLKWFCEEVLPHLPPDMTLNVAGTIWDQNEAGCLDTPQVNYIGHLNQDQLAIAAAESLCVVIPNVETPNGQFEGFGLLAIEAASAGGVVLASDHGGLKEAVIDNITGLSLPSGQAEAWIEAVSDVRGWTTNKRAKFVEQATRTIAQQFSWQRVAEETLQIYRQPMGPSQ